ncbi:MAG: hypothetical protein IJ661_10780 [Lachnospiraceae bacterium]|nr:hypothetical protein [Lachnospiraceae bacterium]
MRRFCVFLLSCILACMLMACGQEQEISGENDIISNNATDENDIEDNSDNKKDEEKEDFFAKDHGSVEYIEVHETGGVDGISCYRSLYKYEGKDNDTYVLVFSGGYGSRI